MHECVFTFATRNSPSCRHRVLWFRYSRPEFSDPSTQHIHAASQSASINQTAVNITWLSSGESNSHLTNPVVVVTAARELTALASHVITDSISQSVRSTFRVFANTHESKSKTDKDRERELEHFTAVGLATHAHLPRCHCKYRMDESMREGWEEE